MKCCSYTAQKCYMFGAFLILVILGTLTVIFWGSLFNLIKDNELSLKNSDTRGFKMWQETPIPMYIEFYLFNLTNSDAYRKDPFNTKPELKECGPYTFSEKHFRVEIKFNDNDTITYKTKRVWHFLKEKTKGSLDDYIVTINPILASIGNMVKDYNEIVQIAISAILDEKRVQFLVNHTVNEYLFEGYNDSLINLVAKLNVSKFNYPYDRFGWFYQRNGSNDYDGAFTMFTGADDISKVGRFTLWNGANKTNYYDEYCNYVNGTSGEYWYPIGDNARELSVFSPDTCSTLFVEKNGTFMLHGIEGYKYVGTDKNFDNGTAYPEMACFSSAQASGTRDVSKCKFGAPAFISYPHFYLADPSYRESIIGMKPDGSKHQFYIGVEPQTGVPLNVGAIMQLNLFIAQVKGIRLLKNVKSLYFPMMWFRQTAELTEDYASQIKMLLVFPSLGTYTGYAVLAIGLLVGLIEVFIMFKKGWHGGEGERLLSQETL